MHILQQSEVTSSWVLQRQQPNTHTIWSRRFGVDPIFEYEVWLAHTHRKWESQTKWTRVNRFKLRADNELILISRHSTYNPIISSQVAVLVLVVDIILADSAERYEYAPPASYQPEKEVRLLSTEYVPITLSSIYNKWITMRLLRETKEINTSFFAGEKTIRLRIQCQGRLRRHRFWS